MKSMEDKMKGKIISRIFLILVLVAAALISYNQKYLSAEQSNSELPSSGLAASGPGST